MLAEVFGDLTVSVRSAGIGRTIASSRFRYFAAIAAKAGARRNREFDSNRSCYALKFGSHWHNATRRELTPFFSLLVFSSERSELKG